MYDTELFPVELWVMWNSSLWKSDDYWAALSEALGISPKVNLIAWLEFELAYFRATVKHFRRYVTETSPSLLVWFGLIGLYGLLIIVGYLMTNPLYTYILNISDSVWLAFMVYQAL